MKLLMVQEVLTISRHIGTFFTRELRPLVNTVQDLRIRMIVTKMTIRISTSFGLVPQHMFLKAIGRWAVVRTESALVRTPRLSSVQSSVFLQPIKSCGTVRTDVALVHRLSVDLQTLRQSPMIFRHQFRPISTTNMNNVAVTLRVNTADVF